VLTRSLRLLCETIKLTDVQHPWKMRKSTKSWPEHIKGRDNLFVRPIRTSENIIESDIRGVFAILDKLPHSSIKCELL
jgi:hypothetical protein